MTLEELVNSPIPEGIKAFADATTEWEKSYAKLVSPLEAMMWANDCGGTKPPILPVSKPSNEYGDLADRVAVMEQSHERQI